MGRYYRNTINSNTIAIGIKGDRHSLCGAIKRFELSGKQFNGLLSLKERCARRIALMKHEQIKSFILSYLPAHLFTYVTKDIFDLRRLEFKENYATSFHLCENCSMDTYDKSSDDCQCPNIEGAIAKLNKYLFKKQRPGQRKKQFDLIYKIPNDDMDHSYELENRFSCFLYLEPSLYYSDCDSDDYDEAFDEYNLINSRISVKDKLLFVDVMHFFGAFRTYFHQPQIVFYRRREIVH